MGDLANMTSVRGEVNGFRLLRWLRGQAEVNLDRAAEFHREGMDHSATVARSRAAVFTEMADDMDRELNPPDYPEDDGGTVGPGDRDTGPCDDCGRLAGRVPVQDNGRAWLACPACAERLGADTVDLNDTALKGGPEAP